MQNAHADEEPVMAVTEINWCTNPDISGIATLTEEVTSEGIKEVKIALYVFRIIGWQACSSHT